MRTSLILASLILFSAAPAKAQTSGPASHAETLADLGYGCLVEAVAMHQDFRFQAQGMLAGNGSGGSDLMSSPLAARWTRDGKTVYRMPSDQDSPLLVMTIDRADVDLSRNGRRQVNRTVSLDLTWWLSAGDGALIDTQSCSESREDVLTREEARSLADLRSPVTNPDLPPRSRVKQALEPVVLIGATAVGTYLLFNLRSRRADN